MKINFFNIILLSILFFIRCNDSKKDGYQLYTQNCAICHSLDGSEKLGPSLNGIYGKKVEINGGPIMIVNDDYLLNSIISPGKDIVKGYGNTMPSFEGVLSSKEIKSLIDFIKKY